MSDVRVSFDRQQRQRLAYKLVDIERRCSLAAFLDCLIFYDDLDLYFYISGLPKPEVTQEAKKKRRYDGRMETETISEKNSFTVCQFWLMTQLKSCYTCVIKWHAIPFKTIGWFYNRKLLKIQDRRLLYDTDINVTKRYTQYRIVNWTIESICKHKTECNLSKTRNDIYRSQFYGIHSYHQRGNYRFYSDCTCMQICIDQCWLVCFYIGHFMWISYH